MVALEGIGLAAFAILLAGGFVAFLNYGQHGSRAGAITVFAAGAVLLALGVVTFLLQLRE